VSSRPGLDHIGEFGQLIRENLDHLPSSFRSLMINFPSPCTDVAVAFLDVVVGFLDGGFMSFGITAVINA
jgi:hypothetical protein